MGDRYPVQLDRRQQGVTRNPWEAGVSLFLLLVGSQHLLGITRVDRRDLGSMCVPTSQQNLWFSSFPPHCKAPVWVPPIPRHLGACSQPCANSSFWRQQGCSLVNFPLETVAVHSGHDGSDARHALVRNEPAACRSVTRDWPPPNPANAGACLSLDPLGSLAPRKSCVGANPKDLRMPCHISTGFRGP